MNVDFNFDIDDLVYILDDAISTAESKYEYPINRDYASKTLKKLAKRLKTVMEYEIYDE